MAVAVYQNADKRVATEFVDSLSVEKSMRFSMEFSPSRRLSMRRDDGKGPSRVSSRLDNRLVTDKQSFPNLKEKLEIQEERELKVDTDNPQFIKFQKYDVRGDPKEWSLPRSFGDVKIYNKKLNCSLSIPANFSSNLVVNLPKDLNQWFLKGRLPEERKLVTPNRNMNALIEAPSGVVFAFPDNPNPIFCFHSNPRESTASFYNVSLCSESKLKSCPTETVSTAIHTEAESFNPQSDTQLTEYLWETEFAVAEFEQQIKSLLQALNSLKVSFRCANRWRVNAKFDADRAESKFEISERVTSDLFEENKKVKRQLDEVTSKAECLQSELLETNKTNIFLKQKIDEQDLANKRFQLSLNNKATQIKQQTGIEKLVKQ